MDCAIQPNRFQQAPRIVDNTDNRRAFAANSKRDSGAVVMMYGETIATRDDPEK
jgi:hypothetical protein